MTVRELIKKLSCVNQDMQVKVMCRENGCDEEVLIWVDKDESRTNREDDE